MSPTEMVAVMVEEENLSGLGWRRVGSRREESLEGRVMGGKKEAVVRVEETSLDNVMDAAMVR